MTEEQRNTFMTVEDFLTRVQTSSKPPPTLTEPLQALWYAAKGDWERAHQIAQDIPGPDGSWVHAHLHREEGDLGNAGYWYARSGHVESKASIQDERMELIAAFL